MIQKEQLLNKISATLFGVAIGESLGIPSNGLSIYESYLKYGYIDGFFDSKNFKAGQYSYLTNYTLITLSSLLKTELKPNIEALNETYLKAQEKGINLKNTNNIESLDFILKNIPLAIIISVQKLTDKELINNFKTISNLSTEKKNILLSGYIYIKLLKEILNNSENYRDQYSIYDHENSLFSQLINETKRIEDTFETKNIDKLSERLVYSRRCVQKQVKPEEIVGILGNSEHWLQTIPFVLFCFFRSAESWKSVSIATNCGGAASLNSSLVGALIGAFNGCEVIPENLRNGIENHGAILNISRLFYEQLTKE